MPAAAVTTAPVADKTSVAVKKLSVECQGVIGRAWRLYYVATLRPKASTLFCVSVLSGASTLSKICLLKYLGYLPPQLTLGMTISYWAVSWYSLVANMAKGTRSLMYYRGSGEMH